MTATQGLTLRLKVSSNSCKEKKKNSREGKTQDQTGEEKE